MFKETHPILGTRDIQLAIAFYTGQLGFKLAFGDKADPPNYIGFRRNAVELHMQFQFEHEMGTSACGFWWTTQTRSSANTVNGALSAIPTMFGSGKLEPCDELPRGHAYVRRLCAAVSIQKHRIMRSKTLFIDGKKSAL
jgi:catechol 2,3-dioxygenase-like lactoylglutathione lyase family enzyme